jgi:hypothetical protein
MLFIENVNTYLKPTSEKIKTQLLGKHPLWFLLTYLFFFFTRALYSSDLIHNILLLLQLTTIHGRWPHIIRTGINRLNIN